MLESMDKALRKFLVRHWIALTSGFILTAICIWMVYPSRGRGVIGSEWFIVPVFLFISSRVHEFKRRRRMIEKRRQIAAERRRREEMEDRFRRCVVNVGTR